MPDDALGRHLAGLPPVRIVYTDLDGTLLGHDGSVLADPDGRPDTSAAQALVQTAEAGILAVAVSGRRASSLQHDARLLGLDGAIAEVGTVIIRDGAHHHRWGEAPRDLGATPRQALDAAGALGVLLDAFGGQLRTYEPWDAGREGGHLLHGLVDASTADACLSDAGVGWARLVDNGGAGGWEGRDDVRAYHLIPRGVGKASAISDDLADRGIGAESAIAIGDSTEDLTMSRSVGTYVMVADGHGAVGGNRFRSDGRAGAGVLEVVRTAIARGTHPVSERRP